MNPLLKKMNVKDHRRLLVERAPVEFQPHLDAFKEYLQVDQNAADDQRYDVVLIFVQHEDDIRQAAATSVRLLEEDGLLWFAYPKKSSKKYKATVSRDNGWQPLGDLGFEPVRQIAIDDDWSALRFRLVDHIKSFTRDKRMALSEKGKNKAESKA